MISNVDINTDVTTEGVRLQVKVDEAIKNYLRLEAVRRNITMGQLVGEIVKLFWNGNVSKTNS